MSFADGLLHEQQDADEKTRQEVENVIGALQSAYNGDLMLASEGSSIIEEAIEHLENYMNGRKLT